MKFDISGEHIATYVTGLYTQYQTAILLYHNLDHIKTVVERTQEIGANYSLNEEDRFTLLAAAWFHDTGYLFADAAHHEAKSVSVMRAYLEAETEIKIIDLIEGCILATKLPQAPKSLLEEIVCDADVYNLGIDDFFRTDKLLKRETELRNNILLDDWEWDKKTLGLLENHKYFTLYCRIRWKKADRKI